MALDQSDRCLIKRKARAQFSRGNWPAQRGAGGEKKRKKIPCSYDHLCSKRQCDSSVTQSYQSTMTQRQPKAAQAQKEGGC